MRIDRRFRDVQNFRDLGGLKSGDGRRVREGFFYRGAGLAYFDEEELKEFVKLHVKTIMDLRSAQEIEALPDPYIEGAERIEHSGLVVKGSEDIDWSPDGMRKIGGEAMEQLTKISGYYRSIAFDNEAYRIMMTQFEEGKVPIYFHCATGKDRTGVAAMIILMAMGVREDEIRKDYLASNIFRKEVLENSLGSVSDLSGQYPEIAKLITIMDGVLEQTFDTVISSIKEKYGDFKTYLLREYGLDESKLKVLRDKYLE